MRCRHFGICGGCTLQHLSYAGQLQKKEKALRSLLPSLPFTTPLFLPFDEDEKTPWAFRQKVSFVFGSGPRGNGLVMGHYEEGSRRIVPVQECPVHSARGNRIAFALRDLLSRAGISAAGPALKGILRHLIIRTTADDREAVAMLVVTRNDKSLRKPVRALLASTDRPDGFFINIHDEPGPFMVGTETIRIEGRSQVRETVGGLSYLVSPAAFFQTNVRAAAVLQRTVMLAVQGSERVLDLYCGSGLFTLPIAAAGSSVAGIEENRQAVEDAQANVRLNRIPEDRIRFIARRVEDALARVSGDRWDTVVLDPPRQGCPVPVLRTVFEDIAPAKAVYVSCNPEALAGELPTIFNAGYRAESVRAIDMFPHTDHIETIVQLRRLTR
jgi:23S rRNA (uracil1939-C5)-methyltransferase